SSRRKRTARRPAWTPRTCRCGWSRAAARGWSCGCGATSTNPPWLSLGIVEVHGARRSSGLSIILLVCRGGGTMPDPVDALILDLLEWIGPNARPYREVIEAWRTSCPRLPVWEEANERGFIEYHHAHGSPALVSVSALGAKFLAGRRQVIDDPSRF